MTVDPTRFVTGILLAGGQSRRMGGGDKALQDLAGRPMLAHVIERLAPQLGRLVLNANGDPARFAAFGLTIVPDTVEGFAGPLAGLLAGLRWAAAQTPAARWVLTAPSDAPFLPLDLVHRLTAAAAASQNSVAVVASGGRVHPVIGLWPVALADDLERQLDAGLRKVLDWGERHASVAVEFPLVRFHGRMIDPFFNVNTPAELAEARALIESRAS